MPLVETVAWTLQRDLVAEIAPHEDIMSVLARVSDGDLPGARPSSSLAAVSPSEGEEDAVETLRDLASGAPVVRAVSEIIELALERRATSIHMEPVRGAFRVRIRVDGISDDAPHVHGGTGPLNIAERRLPQDGRSRIRVGNNDVDIRVAMMPTAFDLFRPLNPHLAGAWTTCRRQAAPVSGVIRQQRSWPARRGVQSQPCDLPRARRRSTASLVHSSHGRWI